jgi:hypothetical protein
VLKIDLDSIIASLVHSFAVDFYIVTGRAAVFDFAQMPYVAGLANTAPGISKRLGSTR